MIMERNPKRWTYHFENEGASLLNEQWISHDFFKTIHDYWWWYTIERIQKFGLVIEFIYARNYRHENLFGAYFLFCIAWIALYIINRESDIKKLNVLQITLIQIVVLLQSSEKLYPIIIALF